MKKYRKARPQIEQPTDPTCRYIALTRGQIAIVDAEDYPFLNQWNWTALWSPRKHGYYAVRNVGKGRIKYMHQILLNPKPNQLCDHRNGNTLDYRRGNLRTCTHQQNNRNRSHDVACLSKLKGVRLYGKRWQARISVNKQSIYLGTFDDPGQAALAYNEAAKQYFGEFAWFNEVA